MEEDAIAMPSKSLPLYVQYCDLCGASVLSLHPVGHQCPTGYMEDDANAQL